MDTKSLENFRKILLERRMELQTDLQRKSNEEAGQDRLETMDTADQADSNYTADYNIKIKEILVREVREIDEALEKMRNGDYGICESCDEEIPEGRLKARPNARFCIRCKDEMEKRGSVK
ncbi:MAG: TraR/DksA C4-type zinc finger protein [bacterium]|nr:MAG: TraR/DksA C4-type zinc finger protein [bacterium]